MKFHSFTALLGAPLQRSHFFGRMRFIDSFSFDFPFHCSNYGGSVFSLFASALLRLIAPETEEQTVSKLNQSLVADTCSFFALFTVYV